MEVVETTKLLSLLMFEDDDESEAFVFWVGCWSV